MWLHWPVTDDAIEEKDEDIFFVISDYQQAASLSVRNFFPGWILKKIHASKTWIPISCRLKHVWDEVQ